MTLFFEGDSVGALEGAQDGSMLRLGMNDGNESVGAGTGTDMVGTEFGPDGGRGGLTVGLDDGSKEGRALILGRSDGLDDGLDDKEGEDDSEGDADLDGEADKLGPVLVEGTEVG